MTDQQPTPTDLPESYIETAQSEVESIGEQFRDIITEAGNTFDPLLINEVFKAQFRDLVGSRPPAITFEGNTNLCGLEYLNTILKSDIKTQEDIMIIDTYTSLLQDVSNIYSAVNNFITKNIKILGAEHTYTLAARAISPIFKHRFEESLAKVMMVSAHAIRIQLDAS